MRINICLDQIKFAVSLLNTTATIIHMEINCTWNIHAHIWFCLNGYRVYKSHQNTTFCVSLIFHYVLGYQAIDVYQYCYCRNICIENIYMPIIKGWTTNLVDFCLDGIRSRSLGWFKLEPVNVKRLWFLPLGTSFGLNIIIIICDIYVAPY